MKISKLENNQEFLPGEDRDYGGAILYIDMLPKSCWGLNLRSAMPYDEWRRLRAYAIARADFKCEICASEKNLECHERWDFDIKKELQKFMRLVCLCKSCHLVTHWGFAELRFRDLEPLTLHALKVNGWSLLDFENHKLNQIEEWKFRSEKKWKIDFGQLQKMDIGFYNSKAIDEYKYIRYYELNKDTRLRVFVAEGYEKSHQGRPLDISSVYRIKIARTQYNQTMSINEFILAFKNRILILNQNELDGELSKPKYPRRLAISFMVRSDILRLASTHFGSGILFTKAHKGEHLGL
jgi:hypothetical protein